MEIGRRMYELRIKKGYSLRELGKRLNIAHSHLSMIENGKKKPNLELLEATAKIYDVSVAFLVGDFTESEKKFMEDTPQLTKSDLLGKYELLVGDRPATNEEIEEMIKYILIKRQMNDTN